jgi:DNA-binding GntR family transcriptional regulator
VTFQLNKRITVNRVSETELYDLYFVMIPLELFALQKCFDHLDEKQLNGLDMIYAKMVDPTTTGEDWIDLNWLFHTKIHELAGSPRLKKTLSGLRTCIKPYFYLSLEDKGRIIQANKEHQGLLEAIQKGDRKKAKRVLHQHLLNGQKAIGKLLKRHL